MVLENRKELKKNLNRIDELVANSIVLGCNVEIARKYGEIKHKLKLRDRPLPENDIWIAALAVQYNLILVTRDTHFQEIENLQTVAWKS